MFRCSLITVTAHYLISLLKSHSLWKSVIQSGMSWSRGFISTGFCDLSSSINVCFTYVSEEFIMWSDISKCLPKRFVLWQSHLSACMRMQNAGVKQLTRRKCAFIESTHRWCTINILSEPSADVTWCTALPCAVRQDAELKAKPGINSNYRRSFYPFTVGLSVGLSICRSIGLSIYLFINSNFFALKLDNRSYS